MYLIVSIITLLISIKILHWDANRDTSGFSWNGGWGYIGIIGIMMSGLSAVVQIAIMCDQGPKGL